MFRSLAPLLLAPFVALVACGSKSEPARPSAAFSEGATMFPAETRALVGLRVDKLGDSPIAQRLVDWLMASDPTRKQQLTDFLTACAVEPKRDLDTITIGIGAGPTEVSLLAKGRFDEATLTACLEKSVVAKGGTFTRGKVGGRVAYNAVDPQTQTSIWITFGGATGVIIATSEAWLAKVLDDKAPKAATRPDTQALLGRLAADAAIWGAVYLEPAASQRIADVTKGAVKNGPVSLTGELALGTTAAMSVKLDLPTSDDAAALVDYARSQHIFLALAGQKLGIGRIVNKVAFTVDGKLVSIGVNLDQAEITQLVEALDKLAEK